MGIGIPGSIPVQRRVVVVKAIQLGALGKVAKPGDAASALTEQVVPLLLRLIADAAVPFVVECDVKHGLLQH